MTKKNKKKKNDSKSQKAKVWYLFGLHGLQIEADNDGFDRPLFNDATLVSPKVIERILAAKYEPNKVAKMMAVAGIRELTSQFDVSNVPHNDKIIEQSPDSFVAVQREVRLDTVAQAEAPWYRAWEIISMLAIAYAANTLQIKTFAGSELAKAQAPVRILNQPILMGDGNFLETQHTVQVATYPINVETYSKEEIRASFELGQLLKSKSGKCWSISVKNPFIEIMVKQRRSSIEQLVVNASRHLYRSYHVQDPGHKLAGGVGVLEILLVEQSDFKKLEKRVLTLVPFSGDTPKNIPQLFADRHSYVHQGRDVHESSAIGGLAIASIVLYVYAGITQSFQNKPSLLNYIDFLEAAKLSSDLWSVEQKQSFRTEFDLNVLEYLPLPLTKGFAEEDL